MDFFEYASIADTITQLFTGDINLPIAFVVGALCFAVVYIFQSVGLFTIATRGGIKHRWMAFVPILNTYYIGVCGQKNRFLKVDTRIIALIAAISEAILCVLYILYYTAFYELIRSGCVRISPIQDPYTGLYEAYAEISEAVPAGLNWAVWYNNYSNIFIGITDIVYLFSLIITLSCFFQTYAARRYFLFAFTSILFPIQGILIFTVRNNKGMSYAEYMRTLQERMYRQYRNQQNYYQNPYNQNPYGGYDRQPPYDPPYGQPNDPPHSDSADGDPFSEFGSGSQDDDPFDDLKN